MINNVCLVNMRRQGMIVTLMAACLLPLAIAWGTCPVVVRTAQLLPSLDHFGTDALKQNERLITDVLEHSGVVGHLPWPVQAVLLKHYAALLDAGDTLGHWAMGAWAQEFSHCIDQKDAIFFH